MGDDNQQDPSGMMAYPQKGTFNRVMYKLPLILWRMGLGSYLSDESRGGSKMLVLTTWGRKSQLPRHTMLSYVSVGDNIFVCSGWGVRSDWMKNIFANPQVTLQIGKRTRTAKAQRVVTDEEFQQIVDEMFETGGDTHFESWLASYGIKADPEEMMEKRDRLCLIAFDWTDVPGPHAMRVDLKWVWAVLAAILVAAGLLILL